MQKRITTLFIAVLVILNTGFSQTEEKDSTYHRFYIGSTFFMLGNFAAENKPDFVQLNFGYRLNPQNVIGVELKTWKYAWPLGIPYGDDFEAPEHEYPGYIREFGGALVYKHYWWKGLYSSVDAMCAFQKYVDENNEKIQNGFQLFMTYRLLGYHFKFFNNRVFVEPSVAITHWPLNTNVPDGFKKMEDEWPNYFLFEPGLHFGINF